MQSKSPVCVRGDTLFADVVKELVVSHVHRVWVIDDDFKPTGVISITDIAAVLCRKNI